MHGNVDDPLSILNPTTVEVSGTLNWKGDPGDPPAKKIEIESVTATQEAVPGRANPGTKFEEDDGDAWSTKVTAAHGTWVAGPASVVVVARVWIESLESTPIVEPWDEPVMLAKP